MQDFISQYRAAFEVVGCPLTASDSCSEEEIETAQQRLGHPLPQALADFYRVAGNVDYFGNINSFYKLDGLSEECVEETGHLVFMADPYGVYVLGIPLPSELLDPMVFFSPDFKDWIEDAHSFSQHIICMIYYEATDGMMMPFTAAATLNEDIRIKLDTHWNLAAETDRFWAYNQLGCAVFIWECGNEWELRVGATKHSDLEVIACELEVKLAERD